MMEPFGIQVAFYLFLAGVAAGIGFWSSWFLAQSRGRNALLGGLLCGVLGAVFLILDLTRPQDFLLVLTEGNLTSAISWGARILMLFLLSGFFVWVSFRGKENSSAGKLETLVLWFFRLTTIGLAVYPGLVLRQGKSYPLWQEGLLPIVISLSVFHFGLLIPLFLMKESSEHRSRFRIWELVLGGLTVLTLLLLFLSAGAGVMVWILVLGLGALIPLVLAITKPEKTLLLRTFLIVAGLYGIRHWIVIGGQLG